MLKLEGVVILMTKNKIEILSGKENFDFVTRLQSFVPFDEKIMLLLYTMSDVLLHDNIAKTYPDVVTFAFFCRKNHLLSLKNKASVNSRLGKGVTFHIAPSNVPINFAYSLISALLSGNSCIIKVSSKDFEQTKIIIDALNKSAKKQDLMHILPYITIVKYDREDVEITKKLSKLCDVRIIWGGDLTVEKIRECPLKASAVDITFTDRYSFAVFSAQAILENQDMRKLCENFYNDTYLYDQNACTAPHLVCFLGDERAVSSAKELFWSSFYDYLKEKYEVSEIIAVDKYTNACKSAIELDVDKIYQNNLLTRISLNSISEKIVDFRCVGGSFLEYSTTDFAKILPIITSKYQTLSYFGVDSIALKDELLKRGIHGIDRIVPVGKTMDFNLTWDGVDLILALSRVIWTD